MKLCSLGEYGCAYRHPETSSQVAKEVEDSRGITRLFFRDVHKGSGGQGYKKETETKPLKHSGPCDPKESRIQIKPRHQPD